MDPQQEISSETLETILVSSTKGSNNNNKKMEEEMKKKLGKGEAKKCPRCESPNTKFCYYNNYSLSQPRYFCKSCRRYWTKGGTLRNVPVGGGCRRNKRSSSSYFTKNNPLFTGMPSSFYSDSTDLNLHKHSSSSQATPSFVFGGDLSIYGNSPNDVGIFAGQNCNFNNGGLSYEFDNNSHNKHQNKSKVFWGFPWQMTGDSTGVVTEVDPGRESWNGLASSWQNGLLNTPLL